MKFPSPPRELCLLGALLIWASTGGCGSSSPPTGCLNPQPHPPYCGETPGEDGGTLGPPVTSSGSSSGIVSVGSSSGGGSSSGSGSGAPTSSGAGVSGSSGSSGGSGSGSSGGEDASSTRTDAGADGSVETDGSAPDGDSNGPDDAPPSDVPEVDAPVPADAARGDDVGDAVVPTDDHRAERDE